MNYDLMVFDPAAAPAGCEAFMESYDPQTEWADGHSYDDPGRCIPGLRARYMEAIQRFPPMGDPFAVRRLANAYVTDYSVGAHIIHVAFAGSVGAEAYDATFGLAQRHRAGFCDVNGSGGVPPWTPPAA